MQGVGGREAKHILGWRHRWDEVNEVNTATCMSRFATGGAPLPPRPPAPSPLSGRAGTRALHSAPRTSRSQTANISGIRTSQCPRQAAPIVLKFRYHVNDELREWEKFAHTGSTLLMTTAAAPDAMLQRLPAP